MFISSDLPLTRRISLFSNLKYRNRPLLSYILGISYLSNNTILGFYITILIYSSPYYRPVSLARTPLSALEIYANSVSRLYAIRTY